MTVDAFRTNRMWTDAEKEEVARLWGAGQTATQIAAVFGGVTRNTIIGIVHRLGLQRSTPEERSAMADKRKAWLIKREERRLQADEARGVKIAQMAAERALVAFLKPKDLPKVALLPPVPQRPHPAGASVNIDSLRSRDCKFPLWEDRNTPIAEKLYCAAPALPGQSWCFDCRAKVFRPKEDVQRRRKAIYAYHQAAE